MPVPPPPLTLAVAAPAMTLPVGEPGWSNEMKVDGWRLAVHVPAGMLQSRRGVDLTARFPEVLAGARELGSVVLDGELVAYGPCGRLEFASLNYGARRRAVEGVRLIYVAFDLLAYRGRDLRDRPYRDRRARLEAIPGRRGGGPVQLMTATDDPERAVGWISAEQAAVGVEGCVAKPLTSRYPTRSGRAGWIKVTPTPWSSASSGRRKDRPPSCSAKPLKTARSTPWDCLPRCRGRPWPPWPGGYDRCPAHIAPRGSSAACPVAPTSSTRPSRPGWGLRFVPTRPANGGASGTACRELAQKLRPHRGLRAARPPPAGVVGSAAPRGQNPARPANHAPPTRP